MRILRLREVKLPKGTELEIAELNLDSGVTDFTAQALLTTSCCHLTFTCQYPGLGFKR